MCSTHRIRVPQIINIDSMCGRTSNSHVKRNHNPIRRRIPATRLLDVINKTRHTLIRHINPTSRSTKLHHHKVINSMTTSRTHGQRQISISGNILNSSSHGITNSISSHSRHNSRRCHSLTKLIKNSTNTIITTTTTDSHRRSSSRGRIVDPRNVNLH